MSGNDGRGKIALVCQRYGLEVNGGSEQYCRQIAERLAREYEVTVYTTCAMDYLTWANAYPPGETTLNGVRVVRFASRRRRNRYAFKLCSEWVFRVRRHTGLAERLWVELQGPQCPELVEALKREHGQYQAVLFMTYLYYTTARGIVSGFDNAILIPTVHDEQPVYLGYYDRVFTQARGIVWNSVEEREFGLRRFPAIAQTPSVMAGIGVDEPEGDPEPLPEALRGARYLAYAGRFDRNKGCDEMVEYFTRYKRERGGDLKLALMGKAAQPVPQDGDILYLGYVSDGVKRAVMENAVALTLFSRYESLSMVVLESMAAGRPVLVTDKSEVLKGHIQRSGAGMTFDDYAGFKTCVDALLAGGPAYEELRENARRYVAENYRWDVILGKYRSLIEEIAARSGAAKETTP